MMYGLPQSFGAPAVSVPLMPSVAPFVGFSPYAVPRVARVPSPSGTNATALLQKWLDENIENPYPNNHDKSMLARSTGKTPVQINNWFANARRRIKKQGYSSKSPSSSSSSSSSSSKSDSDSSRSPSPQVAHKSPPLSTSFSIENILNSPPAGPTPALSFPLLNLGMMPFNPYLAFLQQLPFPPQTFTPPAECLTLSSV